MVLITILTLALALLPATQIVKAEVLLSAAVYFTCATIFGSMAINLVGSDEEVRQKIADWFYNTTDDVKNIIYEKATNLNIINGVLQTAGSDLRLSFSADDWRKITEEILKYYKIYYDQDSVKVTAGKNGHIGFTADSQFTAQLTNASTDLSYIQHIFLNDMTITVYDKVAEGQDIFSHWAMQPAEANENANQQVRDYFKIYKSTIISVNKLSLTHYKFSALTRGTLTAGVATDTFPPPVLRSSTSIFYLFGQGVDGNNFYWKYNNQYAINGVVCYLMQCSDNKWRFVTYGSAFGSESDYDYVTVTNSETSKTYDSFDTLEQFYSVVCDASGLDYPATNTTDEVEGDVYNTPVIPSFGSVPDVYDGTDSVTITVPQDVTDVNDISKVLDSDITISTDTVADYPDGVPEIDSSGLFDKFPFCIPKDLYNLFAGFYSAESKAPKFVFPFQILKRGDSYLIDEQITIDFSILDPVMPMFRWFVTISFTLGLVMITRKMIGAQ